jgi:hypothetical protein
MSKKKLSSEEREGLDSSLIRKIEIFYQTHGDSPYPSHEVASALEAFLIGYSLQEVADRYPNFNFEKLAYTAAVNRWHLKRQEIVSSIYDRVKAKLVRSVVEQVDYMTDMLAVASTEARGSMSAYLKDPVNTPPPANRIRSLKEYKSAIDSLTQLTEYVSKLGPSRSSSSESKKSSRAKVPTDGADILAALVGTQEDND